MATQLPEKGHSSLPQFSAHVYCVQTAGWIKMALGTDVDLGRGYIVLDGDRAAPSKEQQQPAGPAPRLFGPCLLWPDGWMD